MNRFLFALLFLCFPLLLLAQEVVPTAAPVMVIIGANGTETEETSYSGSAPLSVRFEARVQNVGSRTPLYEWRIMKDTSPQPMLVRYDANTSFTFTQSGAYAVQLLISFVEGRDTVGYELDTPFAITISESKMEVPNAFSPNGDGINDVFKVKEGYQSLVEFEAIVVNRWGRKVASWNDPAQGWDGRIGSQEAPEGAYYLSIRARGADGIRYEVKKTINLLRKYNNLP